MPLVWHLQAHLLRALIITYMQPLINGVFLNSEKYYCMLNKPNSHRMDLYVHVHVYSIYSQPLTKFVAKKYRNITEVDW